MKKIRNAYKSGIEGNSLPVNPSRRERLAHTIGSNSLRRTLKYDDEYKQHAERRLTETISKSVGLNKQALEIKQAIAEVPNQEGFTHPAMGHKLVHEDGTSERQWTTALNFGADQDPSRPWKTPVIDSLDSLRIDSTDWSHNGYVIHVDNLVINSSAPIESDGSTGAASTEIHINTRPYDPDNITLTNESDFTGGVKVVIGPDGDITSLATTKSNGTGYTDVDPTKITTNLSELLEGVKQAVDQTAQAYMQIPDTI